MREWLIYGVPTIVLFWTGVMATLFVCALVIDRKDRQDGVR